VSDSIGWDALVVGGLEDVVGRGAVGEAGGKGEARGGELVGEEKLVRKRGEGKVEVVGEEGGLESFGLEED
jgi:hypothetical protein